MSDPLTCLDFERLWNERLDAPGGPALPPAAHAALERHAAGCLTCQVLDRQFQALERVLARPGLAIEVPDGFADRVLAAAAQPADPSRLGAILALATPRRLAALAAAAVVLVGVSLSLRNAREARDRAVMARQPAGPPAQPAPASAVDLTTALTDATSATLSLAWQASAPAARVGREVFSSAASGSPSTLLSFPQADEVVPTTDVMQEMGERVNAGVRPLSGTARSAFSFLIVPASRPAPPTTSPSNPPRGA